MGRQPAVVEELRQRELLADVGLERGALELVAGVLALVGERVGEGLVGLALDRVDGHVHGVLGDAVELADARDRDEVDDVGEVADHGPRRGVPRLGVADLVVAEGVQEEALQAGVHLDAVAQQRAVVAVSWGRGCPRAHRG